MKNIIYSLFLFLLPFSIFSQQLPKYFPRVTPAGQGIVNTRIDNLGYWMKMAKLGYLYPAPPGKFVQPVFKGNRIAGKDLLPQDSPDVPLTDTSGLTQSENSVFPDPFNESTLLNSNNSTDWNGTEALQLYGADDRFSRDAGEGWGGSTQGAGNENLGDPATAIGLNGWWYVGKIDNTWGQSVAWSSDFGQTWHDVQVESVPPGNNILDKNHLWIDNSPTSPYQGHLYAAWTNGVSGAANENDIELCRSIDHGLTWSGPQNLSQEVYAGSFNHGVNICTGPGGEVYAAWSIYDTWPSDETAIGFAMSLNGGETFEPGVRILQNIRGIRMTETSKNMRVNSFPSMTVDNSNSTSRGTIYIVWANIGVPGTNLGPDIDVYMIRSTDQGDSWSAPVRVNQDTPGLGKEHFFPWITCDPATGYLCVVYYDDRDVDSTQCETWVSYSYDQGNTWSDARVSDVAFTPSGIPGLSIYYFGDYLGISSSNRKIYPVWTDNRTGVALSYTSPFLLSPAPGQPYVVYDSDSLFSIASGTPGDLNYRDSLYLDLGLKNVGDQPAFQVNSEVSSNSPYITFTQDAAYYGDLNPGDRKTIQHGYSLKVSDSIPDGLQIRFNVWSYNADTSWFSHFFVESHAPAFHIDSLRIVDTLDGNRNGKLDPGETVQVVLYISDVGSFSCQSSYVKMSAACSFLSIEQDSVFVGDILPGLQATAVFTAAISDEAPVGTGCNFTFRAASGLYHATQSYLETIGLIVEDWESNNFSKFPWQFSGMPWYVTAYEPWEGHHCCRSGLIYDEQSSILLLNYITGVDDTISFYRRVSSEANFDFLRFYVDGVLAGEWSGEQPWEREAYFVPAGSHQFKWAYVKDISESAGQDRGWIDFIEFPPPPLPIVDAGSNDTLCGVTSVHLDATASAFDSLLWTTYGDGTFDNDTIPDPVYTLGPDDLLAGTVRLRLTAYGTYGHTSRSVWMTVGIPLTTHISFFPKDTLCGGQTVTLSVDSVAGGRYYWTPGGAALRMIQVDTSVTGGFGMTLFRVDVANASGCHARDSVNITFKDCTGIPEQSGLLSAIVYPNPTPGAFTVRMSFRETEQLSIRITDMLDKPVFEKDGLAVSGDWSEVIDLTGLPKGIYILHASTGSGTCTRKILLQ
ncbi:MAG TPA: T9SS type A sorting domain-containing protein [Bacteroidales bacterium]|nr:T9SS type A sorting domain-containing protein [Bacteroidales bacterium]